VQTSNQFQFYLFFHVSTISRELKTTKASSVVSSGAEVVEDEKK
jgi:hypothetical protein